MENKVTSQKLSQELWDLGFRKESAFYWQYGVNDDEHWHKWYIVDEGEKYFGKHKYYPSYLSDEIAEWLPTYVSVEKHSNEYRTGFANNKKMEHVPVISGDWMSESMGLMLKYLIETGEVKV